MSPSSLLKELIIAECFLVVHILHKTEVTNGSSLKFKTEPIIGSHLIWLSVLVNFNLFIKSNSYCSFALQYSLPLGQV